MQRGSKGKVRRPALQDVTCTARNGCATSVGTKIVQCHGIAAAGVAVLMLVSTGAAAGRHRQEVPPLEANPVGIFEGHRDIGEVEAKYAGNVEYDQGKGTYTITGGGENIWFGKDALHFAWKQASGDVSLSAEIEFWGTGKNPHRKAVLMVRQNLEADAAYADIALHGNGLTSLQYRDEKGGMTHEVQANVAGPKRVRIMKQGDYFTMWVAGTDGKFELAGATGKIALSEPFYVGIGVCSHEKELTEKAVFSKVELQEGGLKSKVESSKLKQGDQRTAMGDQEARTLRPEEKKKSGSLAALGMTSGKRAVTGEDGARAQAGMPFAAQGKPVPRGKLYSMMEIMSVDSTDRRAMYVAEGRFEAPNWMPDGESLLFNRNGRIEKIVVPISRLDVSGPIYRSQQIPEQATTETIDTGFAVRCNNDHGISPDGKWLVISDNSQAADHQSQIYILPIGGGTPRLITKNAPSYWHGWSPDGKTLAFVGQRNGDFDIYTIPVEGGEETRLTTAKGLDDGPEYTPDGKYIYFNSERTGHMQIWRMKADGSEQTQVTFGPENDWFPHFSPDGEKMGFLTYEANVTGHPENKDVMLRMMTMKDGKIQVLGKLFGGQGTINVPSWSPDGKRFAFVSYAVVKEDELK